MLPFRILRVSRATRSYRDSAFASAEEATMDLEADLERVLGLVYDAALQPERWPDALGGLDLLLGASTCLSTHNNATQQRNGFASGDLMEGFLASYNEHYARANTLWPATIASPTGTVLIDRQVAGRDAFERSEFYNEFARRIGLASGMAVKVFQKGSIVAAFVAARGRRQGEFDLPAVKLLTKIASHLGRAAQMNNRLSLSFCETDTVADVLARLPHAAMLVDASARVLFANCAAQSILAARDGLRSDPGGLHADLRAQTEELRRRVGRCALQNGNMEPPFGPLALTRSSGRRPLSALVTPSSRIGSRGAAASKPAAFVFITDPELAMAVPPERLSRLYGLTHAEAVTALAVLHGDNPRAIADRLNVSLATVKTHLRHAFAKTDTRRQAELVSVLLVGREGDTSGKPERS
jgi:DNA-binding CsgD family transcriptional regulator